MGFVEDFRRAGSGDALETEADEYGLPGSSSLSFPWLFDFENLARSSG